jgi:hypothetical protein
MFKKIDRVSHIGYTWKVADGTSDVRGGVDPLLVRSLVSLTC